MLVRWLVWRGPGSLSDSLRFRRRVVLITPSITAGMPTPLVDSFSHIYTRAVEVQRESEAARPRSVCHRSK